MEPPRSFLAAVALLLAACATAGGERADSRPGPLVIQEQGSFAVGGTVVTAPGTFDPIQQGGYNPAGPDPAGQTLHGDHAYVSYQIPVDARKLPLVLWHGHGQSARTWETTPDGREGFQNIFLRRRFPVYLIDQPRRGRASRSTLPMNVAAAPDEQLWFGIFRLGIWPDLFPGVQFSQDPEALNQFFRQMVPNTGPFDLEVNSDATSALFDKIGPGILVTHSQSGALGWRTAIKNGNVRAVASYEPGGNFFFPEGEVPEPMTHAGGTLRAVGVPLSDFLRLTKIPIVVYYGDNIPDTPERPSGAGPMARLLCHGEALARRREPPRRRRHAGSPARTGRARQYALPHVRFEQSPDRRPLVAVSGAEGSGLSFGRAFLTGMELHQPT